MLGMLVFGSMNTIVLKYQDNTHALGQLFTHPYLQTAIMFLGEFVCMGLFVGKTLYNRSREQKGESIPLSPGASKAVEKKMRTNINPLLLAIPATCDFCGSSLMFIALTQCAASVYQMMRGIIVVITAILAVVFLGRKQFRHHWTSLFMIVLGVVIVGWVALAYGTADAKRMAEKTGEPVGDEATTTALGIILLLISQLFAGCQFITEEKLLCNYYLDPMLVVGTEGMWGLLYYLFLLPIFQKIQCSSSLCNFGYLEDSAFAFSQMGANGILILESVGVIISIACFNMFGIATTKNASAAQRSTIDTSRTLIIWIMSVLLGLEFFHYESIFGFIFLVAGTLIYNEILVVPFFGFDQNTAVAIAARKSRGNSKIGEEETDA